MAQNSAQYGLTTPKTQDSIQESRKALSSFQAYQLHFLQNYNREYWLNLSRENIVDMMATELELLRLHQEEGIDSSQLVNYCARIANLAMMVADQENAL